MLLYQSLELLSYCTVASPASVAYPRFERVSRRNGGGLKTLVELRLHGFIADREVALGMRVRSMV